MTMQLCRTKFWKSCKLKNWIKLFPPKNLVIQFHFEGREGLNRSRDMKEQLPVRAQWWQLVAPPLCSDFGASSPVPSQHGGLWLLWGRCQWNQRASSSNGAGTLDCSSNSQMLLLLGLQKSGSDAAPSCLASQIGGGQRGLHAAV